LPSAPRIYGTYSIRKTKKAKNISFSVKNIDKYLQKVPKLNNTPVTSSSSSESNVNVNLPKKLPRAVSSISADYGTNGRKLSWRERRKQKKRNTLNFGADAGVPDPGPSTSAFVGQTGSAISLSQHFTKKRENHKFLKFLEELLFINIPFSLSPNLCSALTKSFAQIRNFDYPNSTY